MPTPVEQPSWRKPVGMLLIMLLILLWSLVVLTMTPHVLPLHWTLQAIFFALAGTIWIFPLRPMLRWMETGRFR
jgi:membrane protein implicated in regulation of membrane protease activity